MPRKAAMKALGACFVNLPRMHSDLICGELEQYEYLALSRVPKGKLLSHLNAELKLHNTVVLIAAKDRLQPHRSHLLERFTGLVLTRFFRTRLPRRALKKNRDRALSDASAAACHPIAR